MKKITLALMAIAIMQSCQKETSFKAPGQGITDTKAAIMERAAIAEASAVTPTDGKMYIEYISEEKLLDRATIKFNGNYNVHFVSPEDKKKDNDPIFYSGVYSFRVKIDYETAYEEGTRYTTSIPDTTRFKISGIRNEDRQYTLRFTGSNLRTNHRFTLVDLYSDGGAEIRIKKTVLKNDGVAEYTYYPNKSSGDFLRFLMIDERLY